MQQTSATPSFAATPTSASTRSAQVHENEIMLDIERILAEPQDPAPSSSRASASRLRRVAPLVLLAGAGAALLVIPFGVRDALPTGRSVAQAPDR